MLAALPLLGCGQSSTPTQPAARVSTRSPAKPKLPSGSIKFVDGYEIAMAKARKHGKPLLLFFTADWCRYCHQMADGAFKQKPVVKLSDRFVCVLIDADREQELCQQLEVRMFPTVLFVSADGAALGRITGKQPSHKLVIEMQSALQTIARHTDWSPGTITR